jgi:fatty-acyl-CoA synthase
VTAKPGRLSQKTAVIAHGRQHLATFKVPKAVVLADSLPKNPSGKILKRSLRDAHARLYAAAAVTS